VAAEQQRITVLQVNRTSKLVSAGSLAQGELLQLEAQLARDEQNTLATQNAVMIARLQLANLLQLENPEDFAIGSPQLNLPDPSVLDRPAQNVYQTAVENQPSVRAAEMRVLSGEKAVDVAFSGFLPTLSVVGQIGTNYSDQIPNITGSDDVFFPIGLVEGTGQTVFSQQTIATIDGIQPFGNQITDNFNELVGLSLQVPIFNRMAVKNNLQNAKISADIARLNLDLEKNNLRQTIYQAHTDAKAAFLQFKAAEKAVEANRKAFDYARQRFEAGALNQIDFETAKNNLAASQSQYAQAKYDYIFRIKVLEFYLTNQVKL
jgi:outer membrane protein